MVARYFGQAVNGGLCRGPLLGEEIDAVATDNKCLAIEIGGLCLRREISLVFVRKPYRVYFKYLIQNSFFADA